MRRYQFSLASLFRLTTIVAILLAVSRVVGVGAFFYTMAVLGVLVCTLAPLSLLVLLCSLTHLSDKAIVRVEAGVFASLFALLIGWDAVTFLSGEFLGATLLALLLWGPQGIIIGLSVHATATDKAERKLHSKVLPPALERETHTDRSY